MYKVHSHEIVLDADPALKQDWLQHWRVEDIWSINFPVMFEG